MPWTVMPKIRFAERLGRRRDRNNSLETTAVRSRLRRWSTRAALVTALAVVVGVVVGTAPEQASAHARMALPQVAPKPARTLSPVAHARVVHHARAMARAPKASRVRPRPVARLHAQRTVSTPITINVAEVATAADGQAAVNRCAGPVEVLYGRWGYPDDIIQHDYCGGAWMAFIRPGTRIQIVGGTRPGLYVANGNRRLVPKNSRVSFLAGIGDLALQTCDGNQLALIGLTRVS